MNSPSLIISLALENLNCTQKELAEKLSVSQTQITKWKNDEHMSHSMRADILDLIGLSESTHDLDLISFTGSVCEAERWKVLFDHIRELITLGTEHLYECEVLEDDEYGVPIKSIKILQRLGVDVPKILPEYIESKLMSDELDDEELEEILDLPFVKIIVCAMKALVHISPIYSLYVLPIGSKIEDLGGESGFDEIYFSLLELAFVKGISNEQDYELYSSNTFHTFQLEVLRFFDQNLYEMKKMACENNIPIEYDISALSNEPTTVLCEHLESLMLDKYPRSHPDVFMDELLKKQRITLKLVEKIADEVGVSLSNEDIEELFN
ncbi:helix-turn-helix transcriptional regulator [Pseudoalteromonas sp. OFAV1]|uniref:helix-turn-helix domain-containing protein n=1 Tax=Pseudoalteromonas sp. OFAV1 TaxID=2908892 RepID=UPI001F17AFE6|nr:helix-turn-helix transcriptional regulator [Pseudoalteromonas sp. OFAV1]MCF2903263.1 helix-turn-helix transcriptional regulator [Pseudoalteromonas sp. OFAV1]